MIQRQVFFQIKFTSKQRECLIQHQVSHHHPSILSFYTYLNIFLLTHLFHNQISSKHLIQHQMQFQNIFSINWKVKMGCTYLCTTLKYLSCRSYLAYGLMLDFHSKHLKIRRVQSGSLREKKSG